jgi:hypothetical protein
MGGELGSDIAGKGLIADTMGIVTSAAATAAGANEAKTILSAISTAYRDSVRQSMLMCWPRTQSKLFAYKWKLVARK